ncbi:MAG: ATP-binding protein [Thermomicrobiales bacterium]
MKRIGDVMKSISIPISTATGGTSTAPAAAKCAICQDAGWLRVDAAVGSPNFGRLFPCDCQVRASDGKRAAELKRLSNLDAFLDRTFDDFDQSLPGVTDAFHAALDYSETPEGWLFLHGRCGGGKTHLAVAIALAFMERQPHQRVLFSVVPDLLDHLRATFDPGHGVAYDERFDAIRGAQLLILDDLGTENTTPWAREKLYQIFNHRYNEQLPTVITSNQDFKRIEDRVLSRILDTRLTRYVHLDAEDFRLRRRGDMLGMRGRGRA